MLDAQNPPRRDAESADHKAVTPAGLASCYVLLVITSLIPSGVVFVPQLAWWSTNTWIWQIGSHLNHGCTASLACWLVWNRQLGWRGRAAFFLTCVLTSWAEISIQLSAIGLQGLTFSESNWLQIASDHISYLPSFVSAILMLVAMLYLLGKSLGICVLPAKETAVALPFSVLQIMAATTIFALAFWIGAATNEGNSYSVRTTLLSLVHAVVLPCTLAAIAWCCSANRWTLAVLATILSVGLSAALQTASMVLIQQELEDAFGPGTFVESRFIVVLGAVCATHIAIWLLIRAMYWCGWSFARTSPNQMTQVEYESPFSEAI